MKVREVYNNTLKYLDVFVGGLLEATADGPGEVFQMAYLDQFTRLRDGDRFWFENQQSKCVINNVDIILLYTKFCLDECVTVNNIS